MSFLTRCKNVVTELRHHAPFTVLGAVSGIVFMVLFQGLGSAKAEVLFGIFHPLHVALSAMVTAALFIRHSKVKNIFVILIIAWVGSLGVATLSDSVIPFFGESILGVAIPSHMDVHHSHDESCGHDHEEGHVHDENCEHDHQAVYEHAEEMEKSHEEGHVHDEHCEHEHGTVDEHAEHEHDGHGHEHEHKMHIGFIEHWYLVNPAAIIGAIIGFYLPHTKLPHASHVLISTWASSSHVLMNLAVPFSLTVAAGMFLVLFVAVWLPCCVSDIVFPMFLIKGPIDCCVHDHGYSKKQREQHAEDTDDSHGA